MSMKQLFPFIISALALVFSFSTLDPVLHIRFLFLSVSLCVGILLYLLRRKKILNSSLTNSSLQIYLALIFFYIISSLYNGLVAESIFICLRLFIFYVFSIVIINLIVEYGYMQYCYAVIVFLFFLSIIYFFQVINNYSSVDFLFSSSMANKNLLGSVIFLCLPFLIYVMSIGSRLWRVLCYIILFLALLVLMFVKSTAVLIALMISSVSFLILSKKNLFSKYLIRACSLFIIISCVYFKCFSDDHNIKNKVSSFIEYRSSARLVLYKSTFCLIKDNFFLGVGAGNWKIRIPEYGVYSDDELDHTYYNGINFVQRPHNDFLWVFAEAGIFGGICYIVLFLVLLIKSYLLFKSSFNKDKLFYLLIFSTVLGYSFISMVDFPMERISHNILFFLIIAIIVSGTINHGNQPRIYMSISVLYVFLIIAFFSMYIGYVRYNSEIHATNAIRYKIENNWPMVISEVNKAYDDHYCDIDNTSTPLLWYRGFAYFQQNKVDKALADFKQAYKANPNHIDVLNNIATCYGILGNTDKAKEFYKKLLSLNPTFKQCRVNLAIILYNENKYTESLDIILQSRIDHYRLRVKNKDNFDACLSNIFKGYVDSVYEYSTKNEQAVLSSLIYEFDANQTGKNVDVLQKAFRYIKKNKINYKDAIMELSYL